jgi:hypothetical protein
MSTTPAQRARRGQLRGIAAIGILLAWSAALAGLVRRDILRTPAQAYAELALRVNPGNVFYAVLQNGVPIGYASSTIDTIVDAITFRDELVADLNVGGTLQRAVARTDIRLSRGFALRSFALDMDAAGQPLRVTGRTEGDSAIAYVMTGMGMPTDTQRVRTEGPILVPTLLPLATILRATPKVGRSATFRAFDPQTMGPRDVTLQILAESLFVVDDSASFDAAQGRWVSALQDTVRAWQVGGGDGGFRGWVDAQGRVVESQQAGGLTLKRMAYELAFENWRIGAAARGTAPAGGDILEATAIASNVPLPEQTLRTLRVRMRAPSFLGFDIDGGRQRFDGTTLTVAVEPDAAQAATYVLPPSPEHRRRFAAELASDPLLQAGALPIIRQAVQIAGDARDPREIVARVNRWVYENVEKVPTFSIPNALAVLNDPRGDCNEHAQLFTALTRSLGIPTRIASGVAYLNGRFYYHAWAEVYLGDWVAVDPTWGQFPADASHIRLVTGGLTRQAELLRLIGALQIEVEDAR